MAEKKNYTASNIKNTRVRKKYLNYFSWLVLLLLILGSSLILVYQRSFGQIQIKKGDTVTEIIRAPKTVTFMSVSKTGELKAKAASAVPKVYRLDSGVANEQESKINKVFDKINEIRTNSDSTDKKIGEMQAISDLKLTDGTSPLILNLSDDDWHKVEQSTKDILLDLQVKEKIKYDELDNFKNQIPLKVNQSFSDNDRKSIIVLGQELLLPNTFLDEVETNKRIEEARSEITPVYYTVEKDQIVLKPGDKVTDLDLEKLQALGITSSSFNRNQFLGTLLIVIILSLLSFIFIRYFIDTKIPSYKVFLIFTIFLLSVLLLARIFLPIKPIVAYLFPMAAPILLLAILIDFPLALFSGVIFSTFFGLVAGGSFELFLVQLATILVALLIVRNIKNSNVFLKLILFITLVNFVIAFAFNLLVGNFSLRTILVLLAAGLICGLLNAVITAGFLVFIGNILGVTSFLQLADLANPEQPLLKELSLTAPGTYHHSILVSNLAEQGAKAVGVDPLLARVGAYYHDIGKIERALFFVENQEGSLNIHEKMDPKKSTDRIIEHVTDGLKIADAYHLPAEIKNIIVEHHGTTCVQFFYDLARKRGLKPKEKDFRYLGPLPSTKESAIIMLADSVEAATRSLAKFTPQTVQRKIEEIINMRFEEGQLDNSPLTARDLKKLKASFNETASAVFHQRVNYPKPYSSFKKFTQMSWFDFKK